ncbi:MAG: hypothetical protein ACK4MD_08325 [Demequina sp.]
MHRHLSPLRLAAAVVVLGIVTALLGLLGALRAATTTAGLAVALIAVLLWAVHAQLHTLLMPSRERRERTPTQGDITQVELERLTQRVAESERRLIAAVETLRRDAYSDRSVDEP